MNSAERPAISLQALLNQWGCGEALPVVETGWEESLAADFARPWKTPAEATEWLRFAGLDSGLEAPLMETLSAIDRSPGLTALFRHAYRRVYLEEEPVSFADWPELRLPPPASGRFFYLLLALASVPLTRKRHRELGVAESVTRATARGIAEKEHRSRLGQSEYPGMAPREMGWLHHHVKGTVFTIGRLQYRRHPFRGRISAFAHRAGSKFTVFLPEGDRLTAEGLYPLPGREEKARLTARLRETEQWVEGTPVRPDGRLDPRPVRLPRAEWSRIVAPGVPVIEIHIPAGPKLDPGRCRESLIEATGFFQRLGPEPLPPAFTCVTWFLGPQMEQILRPDSNILRFQRAGHRFPVPSSGKDGCWFIFGETDWPPFPPPADHKLGRAVHQYLAAGGEWRAGGLLVPAAILPTFGRAYDPDPQRGQTDHP